MRPNVTDLTTLNVAVQADKTAAKSVKAWIGQATVQLTAPPPPSTGTFTVAPPVGPLAVHDGTQTEDHYLFYYQPQALAGGDLGGLDLRNYLGYGIGLLSWNPQGLNTVPWTLHDGKVSGVAAIPPRSKNGTAEAGLFVGQLANVARWEFGPGNAWMDLWTGGLGQGGHYTDLLFKHPEHVAIYHEHVSANLLLERFIILQGGPAHEISVNVEWRDGSTAQHGITWRAFDIYCPAGGTGIRLGGGTWGCVIGDPSPSAPMCRFWGPGDAISLPTNIDGPTQNVVYPANIKFDNTGGHVVYNTDGL